MLTPAKKKYLFSIYEISLQKAIIRSVDIAKAIQISKAIKKFVRIMVVNARFLLNVLLIFKTREAILN